MYRTFKILHLLALTLFLGSVFGHVVASALGGAPGSAGFLVARQEIVAATYALTLPGLALAILSGVGMVLVAPGLQRQRWLWLHAGLALVILAVSAALVVPAGLQALTAAQALASGDPSATARLEAALRQETGAGAFNIAVAIATLAIGVIRPALRARRRSAPASGEI